MEFTYVPDFIIKQRRKRLRNAIDPCLGFYPESPSPHSTTTPVQDVSESAVKEMSTASHELLQQHIVPVWTPITSDVCNLTPVLVPPEAHPTDVKEQETSIMVEGFLQMSAVAATKRYKRLKRKGKDRRIDNKIHGSDDEVDNSPDAGTSFSRKRRRITTIYTSSDSAEYSEPPARKSSRQRFRKKRQSLATRLLTAAVLSHVDLAEPELCRDKAHTATRRPLEFASVHRLSSNSPPISGRQNIVDPKKVAPFSKAISQFDSSPTAIRRESYSITGWRPIPVTPHRSLRRGTGEIHHKGRVVVPLTFVPLEEHEASLQTRRNTVPIALPPRPDTAIPDDDILTRSSVHLSSYFSPDTAVSRSDGCYASRTEPSLSIIGPPKELHDSTVYESHYLADPVPSSISPPSLNQYADRVQSNARDLPPGNNELSHPTSIDSIEHHLPQASVGAAPSLAMVQPQHVCETSDHASTVDRSDALGRSDSGTTKRLKPLVSFLDDFCEIARAATEMEAAAAKKSKRTKPLVSPTNLLPHVSSTSSWDHVSSPARVAKPSKSRTIVRARRTLDLKPSPSVQRLRARISNAEILGLLRRSLLRVTATSAFQLFLA
ncbi:hypothetical protein A0H81_07978 [Grifola frondosa]|uniref:Uncharacterized protein n=1 Tax=Grifola frondosa TaxID=5627 RepID=A0A1C7M803_GRIFR|nr:hypothetical protein A0H81_07978 [Grifola frondosa]